MKSVKNMPACKGLQCRTVICLDKVNITSEQDNAYDDVEPDRIAHRERRVEPADALGVAIIRQAFLVGAAAFSLGLLFHADFGARVTVQSDLAIVAACLK